MARILLTHSYFLRLDQKQWKRAQPYPPLGTLYATAVLREAGHEVRVFDTMFCESPQEIESVVREFEPEIVAVYDDGFNYLTKMCLTNMREAAWRMARSAGAVGAHTVVCSSDSTDHAVDYLQSGFDWVIRGEGERTLLLLCEALKPGGAPDSGETEAVDPRTISGVSYLDDGGKLVEAVQRPVLTGLDDLPAPAWDAIDLSPYRTMWSRHGRFSLNMVTTRGCPYQCNWCAKPIYGNRYNSHSAGAKAEELELLKRTHGAEHIWFCDDIFGLRRGWVQTFADEVEKRDIETPFMIQSRADLLLKDDTVAALARAGCERVWIGAESGSQKILDAMDKGITVEQIRNARKKLNEHGIEAAFFLQFGYLDETKEDVQATIDMLFELQPDDFGVSVSYPLPGTPFYDKVKAELSGKANWSDSDDLALMYQNNQSPEYYRALHRWLHRRYRRHQYGQALRHRTGPGHRPQQRSWFKNAASFGYFALAEAAARPSVR